MQLRILPGARQLSWGILSLAIIVAVGNTTTAHADDWPQWLGPQRHGVWREKGILEKFPADGPKVRWRTPIGAGYSGPAVADGRVYVTDRVLDDASGKDKNASRERVLCLDEKTGKELWTHA